MTAAAAEPVTPKTEAKAFVDFLNAASGSPFTATAELRRMFLAAAFVELHEDAPWELTPGGRYFFIRNGASLCAFCVGQKVEIGRCGFAIAGAHCDSPALRLKPPCSTLDSAGCSLVACETYGGGIWQSWFDRDLGLAGKVVVVAAMTGDEGTGGGKNSFAVHTVSMKRPLLRIPTIAPHLDSYSDGFKVNKENDLRAILGLTHDPSLLAAAAQKRSATMVAPNGATPRVHPAIVSLVAAELRVDPERIFAVDLRLCDAQPATLGGINGEFVLGQGIDNLNGCFTTARALIASSSDLAEEPNVRMLCIFDHEECGNLSAQGAESSMVRDTMLRVLRGLVSGGVAVVAPELKQGAEGWLQEALLIAVRKSLALSVDNSHAQHPNYSGKHEQQQPPRLNKGPVLKHNANTRYATDAEGALALHVFARAAGVPLQEFVIRQDTSCGTTIGPTTAAATGIRTVDLGNPQLAMHSIREMCGSDDVRYMVTLVRQFFTAFSKIRLPY